MFIPPSRLKNHFEAKRDNKSQVRLRSKHLIIDHEIIESIFSNEDNVYMVYYPDKNTLLIAPLSDELFKKLHKAGQHMLKDKNLKGDKSIALHETLIDHQLAAEDRDLIFKVEPALGLLNVTL